MLKVSEDSKDSFITIAIEWAVPIVAAYWASDLADRLNHRLCERAQEDADSNVNYLQQELSKTNLVTLQQAIGRLAESELQKLMLAPGNQKFTFRVVDTTEAVRERVRLKRAPIRAAEFMVGAFLGIGSVPISLFYGFATITLQMPPT